MCDISTNNTNSTADIDQFYECLKERTFKRDEILLDSYFQDKKGIRKLDVEWNNLFQNIEFGTCQTALIEEQIESPQSYLIINLNSSLHYRVFLHDPKVFFMSLNSKAFHRTEIQVTKGTGLTQLIEATQYKLFSRKSFHCEEEESYNFSACVEQKIGRMTGCRVGLGNPSQRDNEVWCRYLVTVGLQSWSRVRTWHNSTALWTIGTYSSLKIMRTLSSK